MTTPIGNKNSTISYPFTNEGSSSTTSTSQMKIFSINKNTSYTMQNLKEAIAALLPLHSTFEQASQNLQNSNSNSSNSSLSPRDIIIDFAERSIDGALILGEATDYETQQLLRDILQLLSPFPKRFDQKFQDKSLNRFQEAIQTLKKILADIEDTETTFQKHIQRPYPLQTEQKDPYPEISNVRNTLLRANKLILASSVPQGEGNQLLANLKTWIVRLDELNTSYKNLETHYYDSEGIKLLKECNLKKHNLPGGIPITCGKILWSLIPMNRFLEKNLTPQEKETRFRESLAALHERLPLITDTFDQ